MKKRIFRILLCGVLLFAAIALTACSNETEALQARIETLEGENAELQSTVSSLRSDLENSQASLSSTRNELQNVLAALEAANDDEDAQQDSQVGPLAITYGGQPNKDMSWDLAFGDLPLGLRMNPNEFDEDAEIVWQSLNEDIFTVVSSDDGMLATVTPWEKGSAELVVKVGDQETRSWVRII